MKVQLRHCLQDNVTGSFGILRDDFSQPPVMNKKNTLCAAGEQGMSTAWCNVAPQNDLSIQIDQAVSCSDLRSMRHLQPCYQKKHPPACPGISRQFEYFSDIYSSLSYSFICFIQNFGVFDF